MDSPLSETVGPSDDSISELLGISWDFAGAPTQVGVHAIHPYPAKFIPQIPSELIRRLYPAAGGAVLDPFCGSGTTLAEATVAGIPSVGIDLNPLATLIAKVKTTPVRSSLVAAARSIVQKAGANPSPIPEIPRLDHWFLPAVQDALARLSTQIGEEPDMDVRDALRIALSRIIVRVSNQDSDTRYAALSKDVSSADVYDHFLKSAELVESCLRETYHNLFATTAPVSILNRDVLTVSPDEIPTRIGLTITSPPYPNAYEYWLYHKYRMYWLGMDPIRVRDREIGARPHYFRKNHSTAADFERQMGTCFSLLSRVMIPNSFACFLVGRSVIHGHTIDNAVLLQRAARDFGFRLHTCIERRIARARKSFNLSHSGIETESILVFRSEH